jgi:hypothetical protein
MSKRLVWISKCPGCDGSGRTTVVFSAGDEQSYQCPDCNGTGEIRDEVTTPSDDEEPWEDDWLKSVGFAREMQAASDNHLTLRIGDVQITRWLPNRETMPSWSVCFQGLTAESLPRCLWPQTRGDLRRLVAALGVELRETSTKGHERR